MKPITFYANGSRYDVDSEELLARILELLPPFILYPDSKEGKAYAALTMLLKGGIRQYKNRLFEYIDPSGETRPGKADDLLAWTVTNMLRTVIERFASTGWVIATELSSDDREYFYKVRGVAPVAAPESTPDDTDANRADGYPATPSEEEYTVKSATL